MVDDILLQIRIQVKQPVWRGQRFLTVDELKYMTEEWLKEQSECFYFTGVTKL